MYKYDKTEKNKVKLDISLSSEEWEKFVSEAYEKNKGKYIIKGFRKGQAPRRIIERKYGSTVFTDDALELAVSKEYYDFLSKERGVEPVAEPDVKVESLNEKGLKVILTVDIKPEVILGAFLGLTVKRGKEKVTDKEVEKELEAFLLKQSRYSETEGEAKLGDFVTIDFLGKIDEVPFQGGAANDYRLELGSHSFIDNFEEQLVGTKKGDIKNVQVNFPADYHSDELKGKTAIFTCTIKLVEERQTPELTDELVANVTEFDCVDCFKKSIKARLEHELQKKQEREVENKLIKEIVKASSVEIPASMIEAQLDYFIQDFEARLSYQRMKLEDYIKYMGTTLEAMREEKRASAEETVKIRLVMEKVLSESGLKVTEEEINEKLKKRAEIYKKNLEEYKKALDEKEFRYIENDILMDKFFKFLKEKNNIV